MNQRRQFLRNSIGTLAGLSLLPPIIARAAEDITAEMESALPANLSDDDFWKQVREMYTVSYNVTNLNNGGVSPQPKIVQDAHIRYYQLCNEGPTYYMWRILDQGREALRTRLAQLSGCEPEEIAINRNSTEGLNTVIFGLNLKKGDEVVLSKQDYPNMINAWKQREKRDGIVLKWVNHKLPSENEDELTEAYTSLFTDKTKLVHVTHIINWNGQILPVRKIADKAHARGIEVLVDGAHSLAHFQFKIPDLGADYFASSLHKWLCAPFGSGLLYIRKEKIKNVWALLSSNEPDGPDIKKFESLGTRSFASEMAIGHAVDFHDMIGAERKENRLRFLKNYWSNKVKSIPGIRLNTSLNDAFSCAIGNVIIEGMKPVEMEQKLYEAYRIHTVAIDWEGIYGIRITPNVYTSTYDLDRLSDALIKMAGTAKAK